MVDRLEQCGVGTLPHDGVGHDDRGREGRRAPVRRQIDDRRCQAVGEQDVAGEVAMDDLTLRADRTPCAGQRLDPRHGAVWLDVQVSPRDAVSRRPWIRAVGHEIRSRQIRDGAVESLADGDDVGPPSGLVVAVDVLPRGPAIDREPAIVSSSWAGETEPVGSDPRKDVGLPFMFRWRKVVGLEDHVADSPRAAPAAGHGHWLAGHAERRDDGGGRTDERSLSRHRVDDTCRPWDRPLATLSVLDSIEQMF